MNRECWGFSSVGNALPGLSVRFATLTIATLPAWIESGISRHSSSTPDHFRLNFGCALHLSRSKFNCGGVPPLWTRSEGVCLASPVAE